MASLNDYSNNAKILCPFFKMQYKNSIQCSGVFSNQQTTTLNFDNGKHKTSHIEDFCTTWCWRGCPLAIAINERAEFGEQGYIM